MGYLKNTKCYLSGPIENAVDENWRSGPKKVLEQRFGINIFDPFEDPKQNFTKDILEARKNKDFETMRKISKRFVRKDLGVIDRSDFLIAYTPYKINSVGTCHEIINSNDRKKPTLLVCPEGREFISFWYQGFIKQDFMFGSWEDLYSYLESVNKGLHKENDRWSIVYNLV